MDPVNTVVNTAPNQIPADYAAIGVKCGYEPVVAEDLRLLITGLTGEGKSTFASSSGDTLILDFEHGAAGIVEPRASRIPIRDYDHYMAFTDKLIADGKAKRRPFRRIVMDTADEWVALITDIMLKEHEIVDISDLAKGKGWSLVKNRCWLRLRALQDAGYTWTVVAHSAMETHTDPVTKQETTVPRVILYKTLRETFFRNCEIFANIYSITSEVPKMQEIELPGGVKRQVQKGTEIVSTYYFDCATVGGKEGKVRGVPSMRRKFEIPMIDGWKVFMDEYNKAVEQDKKGR